MTLWSGLSETTLKVMERPSLDGGFASAPLEGLTELGKVVRVMVMVDYSEKTWVKPSKGRRCERMQPRRKELKFPGVLCPELCRQRLLDPACLGY